MYIDNRLNFQSHINEVCKSATKTLGFICRTTKNFQNISCLTTLYNSLVRSRLDYASVVWSPIYQIHIQRLEQVQRRFLKLLSFRADGVYPQRGIDQQLLLDRWSFSSLRELRLRSSLIFLFKISNNMMMDCAFLLNELSWHVPLVTTRYQYTFRLQTLRTCNATKAPLYRCCHNLNNIALHDTLDLFQHSLASFKRVLDEILKDIHRRTVLIVT